MKHNIRKMEKADIKAVWDIENATSPDPWSERIFSDCLLVGFHCWTLEIKKEIAGFVLTSIEVDGSHLLNLAVAPKFQRKGLGELLLRHALKSMKRLKVEWMYLEVRESNLGAQKLYKKFKFFEAGVRRAYYKTKTSREDAIVLKLKL